MNLITKLMGCLWTKQRRCRNEDSYLAIQTFFNAKEVESLHELFKKLSSSITDDGLISKEEFQLGLLGSSKMHSLIADRIFTLFDFKRDGKIEFEEFIASLNIFHPNASKEDKAAFMFQFYDTRQNGFIEREELLELKKCSLSLLALHFQWRIFRKRSLMKANGNTFFTLFYEGQRDGNGDAK
ncbi:hypothetical protein Scep_025518 [Stephania cephalantha]|uniref:Calcineurin B-like protein n=1 Tax=Stephania cephalantha TaxID=152367 RepID=A0AAP0HPF4_9MAGN